MKLFDLIWLEAATKRDVTSVPSTGHLEYWVDRRRTGSYEIRISTPMFRSAFIYIYISRSLRFGSMNASWNAADFPSLSCPARSLPRPLPLSPGGWRQMLRFIEFRWIVARNRITRPCIAISQWQGKERFGSRSGERIRRFWRRVGEYDFLCVIFVTIRTPRISKEILFYRYKMENWLIKRSTREVRVQIGLLRKISICSFLLRYRSYLTVKSLNEKNNFIPDTQFFLFFFLYINLFRSKYIKKKKKRKKKNTYIKWFHRKSKR